MSADARPTLVGVLPDGDALEVHVTGPGQVALFGANRKHGIVMTTAEALDLSELLQQAARRAL